MHGGCRLELWRCDHVTGGVIAGVVFDLDGTLTQPGAIDFAAMRRRIGMEERGSVLHWIETRASDAAEREEMHRIVVEVEDEALARMELADGLDEVLEALRAREGELVAGISTRNSASALVRFGELLEARGHGALGKHFSARVARGHHSPFLGRELAHKPSPEPAHECVRVWDLAGRFPLVTQTDAEPAAHPELLFVGDDIDDCRCGRRAGFEAALLEERGARRFEGDAAARRRVSSLVEVARWLAVRG
ncbi:MAG: HAD family hydrolase [Planctomycetota bacterium]|nr:HAD family hydrolase [Planctomycetota bacterium]